MFRRGVAGDTVKLQVSEHSGPARRGRRRGMLEKWPNLTSNWNRNYAP
jgi:hypothetical protein